MTSQYKETKECISRFIAEGYTLDKLKAVQRSELALEYAAEIGPGEYLFENCEPSRFITSRFLANPTTENAAHMAKELTDTILHGHRLSLKEIWEDVELDEIIWGENRTLQQNEHRIADNAERARDMNSYSQRYY